MKYGLAIFPEMYVLRDKYHQFCCCSYLLLLPSLLFLKQRSIDNNQINFWLTLGKGKGSSGPSSSESSSLSISTSPFETGAGSEFILLVFEFLEFNPLTGEFGPELSSSKYISDSPNSAYDLPSRFRIDLLRLPASPSMALELDLDEKSRIQELCFALLEVVMTCTGRDACKGFEAGFKTPKKHHLTCTGGQPWPQYHRRLGGPHLRPLPQRHSFIFTRNLTELEII